MAKMTQKVLERTVEHYVKSGDYMGAKNYVENFADEFKDYDKNKALEMIENAEKGIKKVKEE